MTEEMPWARRLAELETSPPPEPERPLEQDWSAWHDRRDRLLGEVDNANARLRVLRSRMSEAFWLCKALDDPDKIAEGHRERADVEAVLEQAEAEALETWSAYMLFMNTYRGENDARPRPHD